MQRLMSSEGKAWPINELMKSCSGRQESQIRMNDDIHGSGRRGIYNVPDGKQTEDK
jgi:hypothetical protein